MGPSISAEFFGDIGLVVCGQNLQNQTVAYLFDVYSRQWKLIGRPEVLNYGSYGFIGLKVFKSGSKINSNIYVLLMGGLNFLDMTNKKSSATLYQLDETRDNLVKIG